MTQQKALTQTVLGAFSFYINLACALIHRSGKSPWVAVV